MATTTGTSGYNPQQSFAYNGGAYGANVAPVAMPQPSKDLNAVLPGLPQANQSLSNVIGSELSGEISPTTMNLLKNASASSGIASGVPGSQFQANNALANLGLTAEQLQQKGVADYNATLPTVASTQTVSPELQSQINLQNAVSAAAPNPTAAANEEQSLLQQYMSELNPAPPSGKASYSWTDQMGNTHPGIMPGI